jgi:cytochrome c oxidase assembly factor CtaG
MLAGLSLALLVLGPGLAAHRSTQEGVRAGEVLTLAVLVPMLLTIGRPVLLLRRGHRSRLHGAAPGWARTLVDPVNGLAVLLTLSTVLYAAPLLGLRLQVPGIEQVVGVTALAGGFLFFWPLLAVDWTPENRAARDRFVLSLFACGLFVVVGAAVRRTAMTVETAWLEELDPWWGDLGPGRSSTGTVLVVHALVLVGVTCWLGVSSGRVGRAAAGSTGARRRV